MGKPDSNLDRLLGAAAAAPGEAPAEAPLGFATRVVALWRDGRPSDDSSDLSHFVRRIALGAAMVTVVAGIFTYRQVAANDATDDSLSNYYAIADSAIQSELNQ
jgi:hypothetical protein